MERDLLVKNEESVSIFTGCPVSQAGAVLPISVWPEKPDQILEFGVIQSAITLDCK
jgi:hypothetical protein